MNDDVTKAVEERLIGSILLAAESNQIDDVLLNVVKVIPRPLAGWISTPSYRLVAEMMDSLLDAGKPADPTSV